MEPLNVGQWLVITATVLGVFAGIVAAVFGWYHNYYKYIPDIPSPICPLSPSLSVYSVRSEHQYSRLTPSPSPYLPPRNSHLLSPTPQPRRASVVAAHCFHAPSSQTRQRPNSTTVEYLQLGYKGKSTGVQGCRGETESTGVQGNRGERRGSNTPPSRDRSVSLQPIYIKQITIQPPAPFSQSGSIQSDSYQCSSIQPESAEQ